MLLGTIHLHLTSTADGPLWSIPTSLTSPPTPSLHCTLPLTLANHAAWYHSPYVCRYLQASRPLSIRQSCWTPSYNLPYPYPLPPHPYTVPYYSPWPAMQPGTILHMSVGTCRRPDLYLSGRAAGPLHIISPTPTPCLPIPTLYLTTHLGQPCSLVPFSICL